MKKLFALSLAALMVMSLATVAFATATPVGAVTQHATQPSPKAVKAITSTGFKATDNVVDTTTPVTEIAPGKTLYFQLMDGQVTPAPVVLADAVKSVSISTKYTLGQDLVDSIKIVYTKYKAAGPVEDYAYFLAVTMKDSTSTASRDFAADITLKKSSGVDKTAATPGTADQLTFEGKWTVKTPVKYAPAGVVGPDWKVEDSYKVFDFKDSNEETLEFSKFDGAYFEGDMSGQTKLLIKADAKFDAGVANKYPAANINFFNGYNASFNKIGELRLPAEEGSFIYAVAADGSLKAVKADYDDGEECFVIKTRTLGKYAISDKELEIAAEAPAPAPVEPTPAPVEPEKKPNVNTGAAA